MKMNLTRCSRGIALGIVLALSLVAVGTAAGLSPSGTAPAPAENGTEVSMTATIENPFEDAPDQWTLRGETDLAGATWEIEALDQRGNTVTRGSDAGPNVTQALAFENGATLVNVTVTGTVTAPTTFNYENRSAENYTVLALSQQDGGALDRVWSAHRYTAASQSARAAIDEAAAAVEDADGTGQDDLDRAIDAYDGQNFDNAESLADSAREAAEQSQGGLPIVLIGGAVLVVAVIGGGLYYWRSQQQDNYKLQ